jgi:5'-methylthioadenosine phosphorylase
LQKRERMKVALISGTSILRSNLFGAWPTETVETSFGKAVLRVSGGIAVLNRHGSGRVLPPHAIGHRANIAALRAWGAVEAIGLASVGSLRADLAPGSLVSCSDYVSFTPATFDDASLRSLAPIVPNRLVPDLLAGWPAPVRTGMVYVQMRGPRFETKAEIRILRHWGDVVGMTMASEADLCQEAGIAYNAFCMVDNYAHGLTEHHLSAGEFERLVASNQATVDAFLGHVLARLRGLTERPA